MKRSLIGLLTGLMLMSSLAVAAEKKIEVGVNGMVCSFCAQGITKKFSQEPAIDHVKVSLENKQVELELKDGKDISNEKITSLLQNAGYSVSKIERK